MVGGFTEQLQFSNEWVVDNDGKGSLGSSFETLIGTDENQCLLKPILNKAESNDPRLRCISSLQ